jgi:hypothetical protein
MNQSIAVVKRFVMTNELAVEGGPPVRAELGEASLPAATPTEPNRPADNVAFPEHYSGNLTARQRSPGVHLWGRDGRVRASFQALNQGLVATPRLCEVFRHGSSRELAFGAESVLAAGRPRGVNSSTVRRRTRGTVRATCRRMMLSECYRGGRAWPTTRGVRLWESAHVQGGLLVGNDPTNRHLDHGSNALNTCPLVGITRRNANAYGWRRDMETFGCYRQWLVVSIGVRSDGM